MKKKGGNENVSTDKTKNAIFIIVERERDREISTNTFHTKTLE